MQHRFAATSYPRAVEILLEIAQPPVFLVLFLGLALLGAALA